MKTARVPTRALAVGVLALGVLATPVGPADAAKPSTEHISEPFSFLDPNYCDVPGLEVEIDGQFDSVLRIRNRRGVEYYTEHQRVRTTHTLGEVSITVVSNPMFKDLKVLDQGSTVLLTVLGTGPESTYGPDGKAIARNPGQFRFQVQVDEATGEEVEGSFTVIKESTGRTDDFCAAVLPVLTG